MSVVQILINRYVAPFAAGMCMAAATAVDQPVAAAGFVGVAGVFALFGFEAETRFIERCTDWALERCLGGAFAD